ncbi:MAG: hypothetical protein KDC84_05820 [Crocinitomicaceae bacterium]|nr:hypothetical protein [Crocinitomicaceae bacterium]
MIRKLLLFQASLVLVLFSCTKESTFPTGNRGDVVNAEKTMELSINQIDANATDFPVDTLTDYGVALYNITYTSEYLGELKNTRGVLIVPLGKDSVDLIGYFHGTHVPLAVTGVNKSTPSLYDGGDDDFLEMRSVAIPMASNGYAVFVPDYFGYNLTKDVEHPFVYYPELFKANIDGLLAAKSQLSTLGYTFSDDLFLTGWSQGGGAALSAHKFIQQSYLGSFNLMATSGLAGPYDFYAFLKDVFNRRTEVISRLNLYSWALYAVNRFSDIQRPTDQLWSYEVFDQSSAFTPPTNVPNNAFNTFFLSKIIDETDTLMINEMIGNTFSNNWTPIGKVFLHHGDNDDVVPYFNSVNTFSQLGNLGGDLKFYTYPGGDHFTPLESFVKLTLKDFNEL